MAEVLCPICDEKIDLPEITYVTGVTGIPLPDEGSMAILRTAEGLMLEHIDGHSTVEWVEAFRKADAYIEILEKELEEAKADAVRPMPAASPVGRVMAWDADDSEQPMISRAPQRQVDPAETLIPFIPTGTRAEGQVGRKS